MRNAFSRALVKKAADPNFVFLTGDLGFMALESLRDALGKRFINAGVAEQNMVSVAAGLARDGFRPWVYSIAPFAYARPFEQIRNDVCFHKLPVVVVGNGGGYAYGVMGATHHAIDDYGIMSTLPAMRSYVPAFQEDVDEMVASLFTTPSPSYLRLGRDERPAGFELPPYAPLRKILQGNSHHLLFCGPLVGDYLKIATTLSQSERPTVWVLSEFSHSEFALSEAFEKAMREGSSLTVVEEHVTEGGVGSRCAYELLRKGIAIAKFNHFGAVGYKSGRYGSQQFHRKESQIDGKAVHNFYSTL